MHVRNRTDIASGDEAVDGLPGGAADWLGGGGTLLIGALPAFVECRCCACCWFGLQLVYDRVDSTMMVEVLVDLF